MSTPNPVLQAHVHDIDQLVELFRTHGNWDLVQLGMAPLHCELLRVDLGDVPLERGI